MASPADVVYEGMNLDMRVLEVDPIHRRIVLAVTDIPEEQPPRPEDAAEGAPSEDERPRVSEPLLVNAPRATRTGARLLRCALCALRGAEQQRRVADIAAERGCAVIARSLAGLPTVRLGYPWTGDGCCESRRVGPASCTGPSEL